MPVPRDMDLVADESFLLGMIAGLCNQKPRDELMLAVLLEALQARQAETKEQSAQ